MATYYFKVGTGEPFCENAVTGDDAVAKGEAVKADNAPDNTESWRMKYNFSTNSVDVLFDGDDEATAQTKKLAAINAEAVTDKEADAARSAANKADA